MTTKGFLLVMMQPPPAFEEEFNAWYDSEHIPERLAVPGFLTGLRYVCVDGHPRYLAMYDLERFDVLAAPAYLAVAYDNSSPWTKRVTGRVKVWRYAGHQVAPGDGVTKRAARVHLMRLRGLGPGLGGDIAKAVRVALGERPEIIQSRVLAHEAGRTGTDYLVFTELRAPRALPLDLAALGPLVGALDLVNTYAPY